MEHLEAMVSIYISVTRCLMVYLNHLESLYVFVVDYLSTSNLIPAVPRSTETKPKYRNETEIPKRTIKNIGKMLLVSKCWGGNG